MVVVVLSVAAADVFAAAENWEVCPAGFCGDDKLLVEGGCVVEVDGAKPFRFWAGGGAWSEGLTAPGKLKLLDDCVGPAVFVGLNNPPDEVLGVCALEAPKPPVRLKPLLAGFACSCGVPFMLFVGWKMLVAGGLLIAPFA